jgi:hypothetical protein
MKGYEKQALQNSFAGKAVSEMTSEERILFDQEFQYGFSNRAKQKTCVCCLCPSSSTKRLNYGISRSNEISGEEMNNNLLIAVISSAFLIGGGSVYIYMSSIVALTAGKANVVHSEQLRLLTNQMTSLAAKVDQLTNSQPQMMKQKNSNQAQRFLKRQRS